MGGADIGTRVPDAAELIARARVLLAEGNGQEAEALLRSAAASGDIDAMAELGEQLFMRPPPVPPAVLEESTKLTLAAANAGHGGAAHLAALMAANDPSIPDHWQYAFDYLARAATAGHTLAQFELAFLAGHWETAAKLTNRQTIVPETWHALRASLDIAGLHAAPAPRVISTAPHIAVIEGFAPAQMCDWITRRARPALQPAQIYNPLGSGGPSMNRTNSEMSFQFPALDFVLLVLRQRIVNLTGLSQKGMEPPSVFHYAVGQEFSPHYDFLDVRIPALAAEIARTGQRVATLLVYLSDDFDGGETDFPKIGVRYRGVKKGDAVVFYNVDGAGTPDLKTFHAGRPVLRGEKWLLSQFIRSHNLPRL